MWIARVDVATAMLYDKMDTVVEQGFLDVQYRFPLARAAQPRTSGTAGLTRCHGTTQLWGGWTSTAPAPPWGGILPPCLPPTIDHAVPARRVVLIPSVDGGP